MSVQFIFLDTKVPLRERRRLKQFIEKVVKKAKLKLIDLSIIFCNDDYLLNINKIFLQHDYYTDIVTFNLAEDTNIIEGEIYISVDRIRENATINNASLKQELHRVIFHGVLHLCGYKDKSKQEKALMTKAEDKLLDMYFL